MKRHSIGKHNLILGGLIFLCFGLVSCCSNKFGAGVFYPKYEYNFDLQSPMHFMGLGDAYKILEKADGTQPEIDFFFTQTGNSFKYYSQFWFLTDKAYSKFILHEFKIKWEGNEKILLEDAEFEMPSKVYEAVPENRMERTGRYYLSDGRYYWTGSARPLDKKKPFPSVKPGRLFKGKKTGDRFPFVLTMTYQFDDEETKELIFEYEVEVIDGWYLPPSF